MKQDCITAIVTDEFNAKTGKVVGNGHIVSTTDGVEAALASVYVNYLKSIGVVFENEYDGEKEELADRIRKSLLNYKSKAKNGGWFDPFKNM